LTCRSSWPNSEIDYFQVRESFVGGKFRNLNSFKNVKGSHRSQSNETGTSSPYAPDLAPLDFFLLGYVKGKPMEYRAEIPSELLAPIRVILTEIPRETLNTVFLEWMERLQKYVQVDGEYVG
jgi:hypothetical protein